MKNKFYSSRNNPTQLTLSGLASKVNKLFEYFNQKSYFLGEAGIREDSVPEVTKKKAELFLDFQPFPIKKNVNIFSSEDNIFDLIEYLYEIASRPDVWSDYYEDYTSFNIEDGKNEFREATNSFLFRYKDGFELSEEGFIQSLGPREIHNLMKAEIPDLCDEQINKKVRNAILKWKNRHPSIQDRMESIRELADVFEWLKKTNQLVEALSHKDNAAIFELANKFSIRHHNPDQKRNYDKNIWCSWMFHFYLATLHAASRFLQKKIKPTNQSS